MRTLPRWYGDHERLPRVRETGVVLALPLTIPLLEWEAERSERVSTMRRPGPRLGIASLTLARVAGLLWP